jgi:hypothetical protein
MARVPRAYVLSTAGAAPSPIYRRREPENGALHRTVREQLETFLAEQRAKHPHGAGVPRFVESTLRGFLRCGILAHGFVRLSCTGCGAERLVAFSCKGRGVCPSCAGRRMTERAADLVDRVLPHVRHRQWVLSLPFWLRWRCAWDHVLARAVLAIFVRAVFGLQRERAARRGALDARTGSVTVIQRFGGALNLNVHFHTLIPDGVWTEGDDGALTFHSLPAPSDDELRGLCDTIERRVKRLLVRRGLWVDDDTGGRPAEVDELPPLAALYEASVRQRAEGGERAGAPLRRVGAMMSLEAGTLVGGERRTQGGFDLHAGVVVRADDRERLEHLCRYLLRPPLANERLEELDGGDLLLKLKTRWADGTTHLRLSPTELLERLAALVPKPRTNEVIYHGVLAGNAKWRPRIVPRIEQPAPENGDTKSARPNHTWAELMRRGLHIDGLECPKGCGQGRLRLVACIEQPAVIRRILLHLGLPAEPVRPAPARAPPATETMDWGA